MGNHQEKGLLRRFLHCLEKPVGSRGVHLLGEVDHNCLVASLDRSQVNRPEDLLRLGVVDHGLLALDSEGIAHLAFKGERIGCHEVPPVAQEQLRPKVLGLLLDLGAGSNGIDVVDVRMDHPADLVFVAEDLREEGQHYVQRSAAIVLVEHHGMWDPSAPGHVPERLHHSGVACYAVKCHSVLSAVKRAICAR